MYYYLHVIFLFAKVYYMQFIRKFQLKYDYNHTKSIYLCTSYHNHLFVNVLYGLMKIIFLPWIVGTSCVLPGRTSWRLYITYVPLFLEEVQVIWIGGLGLELIDNIFLVKQTTFSYNFHNVLFLITLGDRIEDSNYNISRLQLI